MPDKQLFTFRMPVGVAAIITAGNFPVAVPSWYLVPALLCGNAVVWKPAEYAPALGDGARRSCSMPAALPDGVLNRRAGRRPDDVRGPRARARARAWSTRSASPARRAVGREIGELCGRHLQSPCLELGGKNPMVVMADADLDLAVEGALFGGFGTAGQRCTSLGTAIVHERVHDEFLARLRRARSRRRRSATRRQDVLYGPMIDERFLERFDGDYLGLIRDHHAVHGSTGVGRITADNPRAGFVGDPERRALRTTRRSSPACASTTSSPTPRRSARSSASRRYGDFDEAMALANGHGYGLSSAIYTTDPTQRAAASASAISAGMVSRQQLDLGRRGAPAVRRQRQVRQRLAPVRRLGARPVHPLAVDELGLRGQAAEGADGRRRRRRRPRLPAR